MSDEKLHLAKQIKLSVKKGAEGLWIDGEYLPIYIGENWSATRDHGVTVLTVELQCDELLFETEHFRHVVNNAASKERIPLTEDEMMRPYREAAEAAKRAHGGAV